MMNQKYWNIFFAIFHGKKFFLSVLQMKVFQNKLPYLTTEPSCGEN